MQGFSGPSVIGGPGESRPGERAASSGVAGDLLPVRVVEGDEVEAVLEIECRKVHAHLPCCDPVSWYVNDMLA